jgi:alpha-glucosidase
MELFVRWVQNGTLHPRFTIHSWNEDGTVNEPWMYPQVLPIIREAIEFRYRLIPYLYSLFFEAARSGKPIIRPMVYHFPHDSECHSESFDFMLGPNLLVASVLEDGARTRRVYLPKDTDWCDFYTGQWYPGGQTIEVAAPLERIPLFVPEGGAIPMGKVMRYIGEKPDDLRQVYVYPSPALGRGAFKLIEDDGTSNGYQDGIFTEIEIETHANSANISIHPRILQDGYPLPYSEITFILPPGEERALLLDGETKRWRDDQGRRHASISVSSLKH